ncbi:piggyBac transposable element-derived protein 4-like [Contarinia nasturtii]|uniref:piggyBac transposable element-derived protein 4-like n=1 Tax=Contarinia nasturtii TaxID=265458 RepID=UPI0012D3A64F|nr:piggyBac transposable element-derived protein 4-like [Contarinia nasturtii]
MLPIIRKREHRLSERQISDAMQANYDDEMLNADFAGDEESSIDDFTDSEEDYESNFEEEFQSENKGMDTDLHNETEEKPSVGTECEPQPIQLNPNQSKLIPGQHFDTHFDYFDAIFSQQVMNIIVRFTNIEGHKRIANFKNVDDIEIRAFIGLLFAAGVDRSSKRNYREFYGITRGMPLFRATLSLTRFMELLRFLRFDDKDTRSERRKRDKLAPIRDLFELVVQNLGKMYTPAEQVTVDKQLVAFRGRCSFKQYLPSKPDKFGLKIFWLVDTKTLYPLNAIPYLGRERSGPARKINIAKDIVLNLTRPYFKTNRTVVFENFFSNHDTQRKLQSNGLYSVSTVRKNKRFMLDELFNMFTVQRKTNRWPMAYFMNLVNVAGMAAFVLWRTANNKLGQPVKEERKKFLTCLYIELTYQHISRRTTSNLSISERQSINDIIGNDPLSVEPSTSEVQPKRRRRCHICPRKIDRKSKQQCGICHRNVCKEHAYEIIRCKSCHVQPIINASDSE